MKKSLILTAFGLLVLFPLTRTVAADYQEDAAWISFELAPPDAAAKDETFEVVAVGMYDPGSEANLAEYEYTSGPNMVFYWEFNPDGEGDHSEQDNDAPPRVYSKKSTANVTYDMPSTQVDDKTVRVRIHVTGEILYYGFDDEKGTDDDEIYPIDEWSPWVSGDLTVICGVDITHCPDYFVPGHENKVRYRIDPAGYTAPFAKFEIFTRDDEGNPTGDAVYSYSGENLNKTGGVEHEFIYSGTQISWEVEKYLVKISAGVDSQYCNSDVQPFDVLGYDLYYFFWDILEDGYASGIDINTVTNDKVSTSCWYYDESQNDADPVTMTDINIVEDMGDALRTALGISAAQKDWYVERGSVYVKFNTTFYEMSEDDQYFFMEILVNSGGVLDKAQNPYDADPGTEDTQTTVKYKMRISSGTLEILETTYYE